MNVKGTMVGLLVVAGILFAAMEYSRAAAEPAPPPAKIGIISIRGVFKNSARHTQYQAQALAGQRRARTQLEDLSKDIQADEAGLQALKPGTPDYLNQLQIVLDKRAKLDGQQEYLKQQRSLEDKTWMEGLYQETLKIIQAVAKEKGLNLVLERTEPDFQNMSSEELMMTFNVHKVLYADGCVDLTAEVTSRLDAAGATQDSTQN